MPKCPGCKRTYTLEFMKWGVSRLEKSELSRLYPCLDCGTTFLVTPVFKTTRIGPESSSLWYAWKVRFLGLWKRAFATGG